MSNRNNARPNPLFFSVLIENDNILPRQARGKRENASSTKRARGVFVSFRTELTPGHADRTSLMAIYFGACIFGILLAILAPAFVDTTAQTGFIPLAFVFCAIFVSGGFCAAAKLKEKPAEHANPPLVGPTVLHAPGNMNTYIHIDVYISPNAAVCPCIWS